MAGHEAGMEGVPMEWEPLFDIGCMSGRPVIPRDDREDKDSDPERDEKPDARDHAKPDDDNS